MEQPDLMHTPSKKLLTINHSTSGYKTSKPKSLMPLEKDWFSFILTNLKPGGDN